MTTKPSLASLSARGEAAAAKPDAPFCQRCLTPLELIIAGTRCPRCKRVCVTMECGARWVVQEGARR